MNKPLNRAKRSPAKFDDLRKRREARDARLLAAGFEPVSQEQQAWNLERNLFFLMCDR